MSRYRTTIVRRLTSAPQTGRTSDWVLTAPECMNFSISCFYSEYVAALFHIPTHAFIIDVISEIGRNLRGLLREFFGIIGQ